MIRAVVLDVGGVLEVIDDAVFPAALTALGPLERDPVTGAMTEAEVRAAWRDGLSLTDAQADELVADFWRWYVGTLDRELFDWFAAQRPARRTGILSNSSPGAREAERHHGFEAITDDIVYSHEVGLAKPDRRIYALTVERLGVLPHEVVFVDDVAANVEAARKAGFHAVLHRSAAESIREADRVIDREAGTP